MWWDSQFDRIPATTQDILQNPQNEIWVSIVSLWEMQIKVQLEKLTLRISLQDLVDYQQRTNKIQLLSVTLPHILELEKLPLYHRDPFDRLLIAQSRTEQAVLVSRDLKIRAYDCQTLW
jgi:PIN domain nuclease of toxin-antitoxin system